MSARSTTHELKAFSGSPRRRRFGRYETLFRIAGGGMAEVYAARIVGEGGFEKVVALKRMLPSLAEDERFVSMFLDEGRVAANISSPHVVQTLDLGRADDDSLYLVMELVVGLPLSQLIRGVLQSGEYVNLSIAAEILAQAAIGLDDAHQASTPMGEPLQLIHRDISPQNILVDRTGRTRITDFGVARAMQSHSHTQTGEVKGKMAYFAPEQAKGGTLTSRVDIFALGIVGWELITARRLFKSDNPLNTLRKVIEEDIPSVTQHRPGIPEALAACIAKALERNPDDRFETGRDFAAALRAAVPRVKAGELGAYVQKHGSEALAPVEEGLRRALADDDEEATRVTGSPLDMMEAPHETSTSAVVPTGTLSTREGVPPQASTLGPAQLASGSIVTTVAAQKANQRLLMGLSAALVAAVAIAAFLAFRSPATTTSTPLPPLAAEAQGEGAQAPPTEAIAEPEEAPAEAEAPGVTPVPVPVSDLEAPEAAPEPATRMAGRMTRRGARRGPSMLSSLAEAAAQTAMQAAPERTVSAAPSMMAAPTTRASESAMSAAEPAMAVTMREPSMMETVMATPMGETSMSGSTMVLMDWGQ
ncbi:MAG: serine/threonine-protein kinase [Myxococcota bacterium]